MVPLALTLNNLYPIILKALKRSPVELITGSLTFYFAWQSLLALLVVLADTYLTYLVPCRGEAALAEMKLLWRLIRAASITPLSLHLKYRV